jgi:hypothetical protein
MVTSIPRLILSVLLGAACAQEPPPAPKPPADPKALLEQLRDAGVQVDLERKTVSVPAVINQPADPIEYLLIQERGKTHEALCVTKVKPSLLNAALLLLGYSEGRNVSHREKVPRPSEDELRAGAPLVDVIPPEGMPIWLSIAWQEAEQKEVRVPVEDLLVDLTACGPVTRASFIFLGGRFAPIYRNEPPVYVADFEGNIVSNCYLVPENHLVTIRHERADDDQNWWIAERTPPPGTPVTFTFHATKPDWYEGRDERVDKQNEVVRKKIEAERAKLEAEERRRQEDAGKRDK